MEAAGALRAAAPNLESIPNPPLGCGLFLGAVWLSVVINHSFYVVLGLNWP